MSLWSDLFTIFKFAGETDPLKIKNDPKNFPQSGVMQPDALNAPTDIGTGSSRQTYEMVDTTNNVNRTMRIKEYDRLRNVPEIEQVLTIIADEACLAGSTEIPTLFGFQTIESLAKKYKPDERFLVYCWDFQKEDYTLGWAFNPRVVKKSKTMILTLDNGSEERLTPDHRILNFKGEWVETQNLKIGDEIKPFYKLQANPRTGLKKNQFPRIFTYNKGWVSERRFIDEWKSGKVDKKQEVVSKIMQMIGAGIKGSQIAERMGKDWMLLEYWMKREGFTPWETRQLYQNADRRRIVGIRMDDTPIDVYDMSVETHKCFATKNTIVHNCQKDDDGNLFKITCSNQAVVKELELVLRHRKFFNLNYNGQIWFKNLCINGDVFLELIINPDNPKQGLFNGVPLPPETIFRIETNKGKLLEFQQAENQPDYSAIADEPSNRDTSVSINNIRRFAPNQMVHFRIGDNRVNFYPYGQSLIEPARGPAYNLKLMEDSMVVYRLARASERRVFYIDVGNLAPQRVDAFMDRMKDQFRKRKTTNTAGGSAANQVEERWAPPAVDEDIWLAIRPNTQTKIETLPGAQSLGEVDDAIFFRNKLYAALNFPPNYFANTDVGSTRLTLSAQDCKFARMIERLQGSFQNGLLEIAENHLEMRGFPEEAYEDLVIKMTPPSEYRELSRAEVLSTRYTNASTLKSGQLMSDLDIYIEILKYDKDRAEEMIARLKIQKLEDLKLQIIGQNPDLAGIGIPQDQQQNGQELSSEPTGQPGTAPAPDGQPPMDQQQQPTDDGQQQQQQPDQQAQPQEPNENPLEEPHHKDIKKFDLEITDYETEMDNEEPDNSIES